MKKAKVKSKAKVKAKTKQKAPAASKAVIAKATTKRKTSAASAKVKAKAKSKRKTAPKSKARKAAKPVKAAKAKSSSKAKTAKSKAAVSKPAISKRSVAKRAAPKKVVPKTVARKATVKKTAVLKPAPKKTSVANLAATAPRSAYPALVEAVIAQLGDAKAEQVVTIDLQNKSTMADYMVVASGRSNRHVNAIADQVVEKLSSLGQKNIRVQGIPQCDWVLVDSGDLIVHIFRPEVRTFYNLEKLWSTPMPQEARD